MSRTTSQITAQCDAGVISIAEARAALSLVIKGTRHAADYGCDSLGEYQRFNRLAAHARRARAAL